MKSEIMQEIKFFVNLKFSLVRSYFPEILNLEFLALNMALNHQGDWIF